jgi:hypothetical protein
LREVGKRKEDKHICRIRSDNTENECVAKEQERTWPKKKEKI